MKLCRGLRLGVERVEATVKRSLRLFPSGWRTLHHSLLGNNSRPPTTELVRGKNGVRVEKKEAGQPDGRWWWWGGVLQEMREEGRPWGILGVGVKPSVFGGEGRGVVMVFMSCRLRIFIVYVWVLQQESSYQHVIHLSVGSSSSPSCCTASWQKKKEHQGVKCKMTFLLCQKC